MERALLFDSMTWLIGLAPFLGVLAAGLSKRRDPRVEGDRVLRHDLPAMVTHWAHGLGTVVLLGSGIALGFLFVPTLLGRGQPVWTAMDVHFVAAVVFLFGTFYYGANAVLAPKRLKEHLPTRNAIEYTRRHYGLLLGFKKLVMPPERKYFESEKVAYLMAATGTIVIVVTGLLKVGAHVMNVPAGLMAIATPVHDLAALLMILFIIPHILFGAVLPSSWPILRSMFTGYVRVDYARREHAGWLEEIGSDDDESIPIKTTERPAA